MSEFSALNDDFEKVDQDELVTSTGDMAEEDRYTGTPPNEASDLVNEFAGSSSGQEPSSGEPLINLGAAESTTFSETQSPPAAEAEEKSEGCFMQTVDPRDDLITSSPFDIEPKLEEMDEPSSEVSAEPTEAQAETSCDMCSGENLDKSEVDKDINNSEDKLDSDSLESSSCEDYSSSDFDGDSDCSSSEYEEEKRDNTEIQVKDKLIESQGLLTAGKCDSHQTADIEDVEEVIEFKLEFKPESVTSNSVLSDENIDKKVFEDKLELEQNQLNVNLEEEIKSFKPEDLISNSGYNNLKDIQDITVNCEQGDLASENMEEDSVNEGESEQGLGFLAHVTAELVGDQTASANTSEHADGDQKINAGNSETDSMDQDTKEEEDESQTLMFGNASGVRVTGLTESDMSDILDRLTKDDEPVDMPEPQQTQEPILATDGTKDSSSSEPSSDSDCESIDSDISGDEMEVGNWSPSPLHTGGYSFVEDDEDEKSDSDEDEKELETSNHEADGGVVLKGYEYKSGDQIEVEDKKEVLDIANKNEAESIVEAAICVESNQQLETVPLSTGKSSLQSLASSMAGGQCHDLLHVSFQSPTNTIFYDPESPVVERVAVEVKDELIDYDDEAKDLESEKECDKTVVSEDRTQLEAEVVKDLKDVYESIEARGEIEGALELLKESGLKNVEELANQITQDVIRRNRSDKNSETEKADAAQANQVDDENEVILRKNTKNVDNIVLDSFYKDKKKLPETYHSPEDNERDISEEVVLRRNEVCTSNRNEIESMIIHDVDNTDLTDVTDVIDERLSSTLEEKLSMDKKNNGFEYDSMTTEKSEKTDNDEESGFEKLEGDMLQNIENLEENVQIKVDEIDEKQNEEIEEPFNISVNETVVEANPITSTLMEQKADSIVEDILSVVLTMNKAENEKDIEPPVLDANESKNDSIEDNVINDDVYEEKQNNTNLDTLLEERLDSKISNIEGKVESIETTTFEVDDYAQVSNINQPEDVFGIVQVNTDVKTVESSDTQYTKGIDDLVERMVPSEVLEVAIKNEMSETELIKEQLVCAKSESELEANKEDISDQFVISKNTEVENTVVSTVAPEEENKLGSPEVTTAGTSKRQSSLAAGVIITIQEILAEVLELIYWRDVKKTGVVFGSMMFVLLSLACFSLLSVLAYLSLATLTVTFSFRVYKNVMQAVQKTNEGHPFQKLMDLDLDLKEEVVRNAAEKIANNMNNCSRELRRLYLVGDYIDSLKFGLLLWLLTYIGAWFSGMTLVILAVVSIFTLPKVYETYQGPIDQNVNLVRGQLNNIMAQVSAKIPFPKKKVKAQ